MKHYWNDRRVEGGTRQKQWEKGKQAQLKGELKYKSKYEIILFL
jgi:hypothetical protein